MGLNLSKYLILLWICFRKFKILAFKHNIIIVRSTLDSVKEFGEGGSLDTKFCVKLKKKLLNMEQF